MSVKVQVILSEQDASQFKSQALKDSKSLSSWLRDAGKAMLDKAGQKEKLNTPAKLRKFFRECNRREKGTEPGWEEQKALIQQGYQGGNSP